jgi:hypothetical protein
MRTIVAGVLLILGILIPGITPAEGTPQISLQPAPPPLVTAAGADWQTRGEPVVYGGNLYYPAGPTVFFDGNVMRQVDSYQGIPLYVDTTLQPNSIVLVPIGRSLLRPYERRREGDLAGTTGSRVSSFPVQHPGELGLAADITAVDTRPVSPLGYAAAQTVPPVSAGAPFQFEPATEALAELSRQGEATESVPSSLSNAGIWIAFNQARWYLAGSAVRYSPDRFVKVGDYRGAPVYREKNGASTRIYVPAVEGGLIAPFVRRAG